MVNRENVLRFFRAICLLLKGIVHLRAFLVVLVFFRRFWIFLLLKVQVRPVALPHSFFALTGLFRFLIALACFFRFFLFLLYCLVPLTCHLIVAIPYVPSRLRHLFPNTLFLITYDVTYNLNRLRVSNVCNSFIKCFVFTHFVISSFMYVRIDV